MWKAVLAGTAALAIAGSSIVYAQQRSNREGPDGGRRWQQTVEDMRAYSDARLAALKAGLALNADQEKNWPAYEQAAREFSKLRLDRMTARHDRRQDQRGDQNADQTDRRNPAERMRRRGTAMAQTGAALQKLADATEPLYNSLDDAQKRRFAVLSRKEGFRSGRHDRHGMMWRHHRDRAELSPRRFDGDRQSGSDRRPRRDRQEQRQERGPENL
jgi:hypothetical protein